MSINKIDLFNTINDCGKRSESIRSLERLFSDTINNENSESEIKYLIDFKKQYEKMYYILKLDDENMKKVFDFGMMYALADTILFLDNHKNEQNNLNSLIDNNKLVLPLLQFINERCTVEIKDVENEFAENSSLEKVLETINELKNMDFISEHIFGDYSYLTITDDGKSFLESKEKNKYKSNVDGGLEDYISENDLIKILEFISEELVEDKPTNFNVLLKINNQGIKIRRKIAFKKAIDDVVVTRKKYLKKVFANSYFQCIQDKNSLADKLYNSQESESYYDNSELDSLYFNLEGVKNV